MASKIKRILKHPRVLTLIFFIVLSLLVLPTYQPEGVEVAYVSDNSVFAGIEEGEYVYELNGNSIKTLGHYTSAVSELVPNSQVTLQTKGGTYRGLLMNTTDLGITVRETSRVNLDFGLDLKGGARVTLEPITVDGTPITQDVLSSTASVLTARLNVYGLKNMVVRTISDASGRSFIDVEMAGEGSEKIVGIVKSVGKFELKIINESVFSGEAIVPPIGEPQKNVQSGSWEVPFTINTKAAGQLRDVYVAASSESPSSCTSDTDCSEGYGCASSTSVGGICLPNIRMLLDDRETFSAPASFSLYQTWKFGEVTKDLVVQTGGQELAEEVQIVLEAGRLPGEIKELRIVSQDYIDPKLGKDFLRGAIISALGALLAVGLVVFIRYRSLKITLPIILIVFSEVLIILGIASLIKWSIDLPAIAGIIAAVGTGVDQQIIITDWALRGGKEKLWNLRRNIKKAFTIIMVAASTTIAAMMALAYPAFSGLYALRGFAIVTIIGVLIGILVARPAYARAIEIILE